MMVHVSVCHRVLVPVVYVRLVSARRGGGEILRHKLA